MCGCVFVSVCMHVCVCVCVCERERERERESMCSASSSRLLGYACSKRAGWSLEQVGSVVHLGRIKQSLWWARYWSGWEWMSGRLRVKAFSKDLSVMALLDEGFLWQTLVKQPSEPVLAYLYVFIRFERIPFIWGEPRVIYIVLRRCENIQGGKRSLAEG